MRRSSQILILALLLCAAAIDARAQDQPPAPQQPASPAPAASPAIKPQATAPKRKARKVITNDDIQGIGSIYKGTGGPDLSGINDCDRNCFESVRSAARIYPSGVQWKRDLLDAIERVRDDAPWQALLSDYSAVRGKFCALEQERNEELARNSDPQNVTPAEISVEEKYDRLFKAAQADLLSLYDRARVLRQAHAGSALELGFMDYQTNRIITASCNFVRQPGHPNWESSDDP